MIAELAACNAAFQTVKTFIVNGKSLADCAQHIATIVSSREELEKKLHKKKTGFLASLSPQTSNDLEEFLALEKIKENEAALKEMMIYHGRGGMWNDWVAFQAKARKLRREEERKAKQKRQELMENILIGIVILTFVLILAFFAYLYIISR